MKKKVIGLVLVGVMVVSAGAVFAQGAEEDMTRFPRGERIAGRLENRSEQMSENLEMTTYKLEDLQMLMEDMTGEALARAEKKEVVLENRIENLTYAIALEEKYGDIKWRTLDAVERESLQAYGDELKALKDSDLRAQYMEDGDVDAIFDAIYEVQAMRMELMVALDAELSEMADITDIE